MSWYNNFKFKLKVPQFKIKLKEKFEVCIRERSKIELVILRFNKVPEETLQKSLSVKLLDAVLLKETLIKAS